MIYLWNTKTLSENLKNNELSQTDKFKYFFIIIVINTIIFEFSSGIEDYENIYLVVGSSLNVLITVFGLIFCYKTNQSGDNKEFIERYFCLSLPITIKLIVLFLVLFAVYITVDIAVFNGLESLEEDQSIFEVASIVMFGLLFYWRLYYHIKLISH